MPPTRPNIVFIVLDTARASAFEPWGAPTGTTPAVAQLAARGAAARHAVAPCSWTMPSHASMFTGLLPRTVGLADIPRHVAGGTPAVLGANQRRLLPEVLRKAGYNTAAVSANPWIAAGNGFDIGFDTFTSVVGTRDTHLGATDLKGRLRWLVNGLLARADDGLSAIDGVVDGWLTQAPKQPFFWFFNLMECHSPYLPPRPWNDLGFRERRKAVREASDHLTLDGIWKASAGGFDIGEDALRRMRHLYSRSVSMMDDWVARLLTRLDRRGLLDDTVVMVTADHGENLGEGRLIGHAFSLDHRLIQVPLVVAGPDPVALPDLLSTVAVPRLIGDAAGLAANPWARDRTGLTEGIAIAQYDGLTSDDDPRIDEALNRWGLGADSRAVFTTSITTATDGHHKLVRRGAETWLHDLDADPMESTRLPVDGRPEVSALADAIARADASDADPDEVAALVAAAGGGGETPAGLEDQLRLLGYL